MHQSNIGPVEASQLRRPVQTRTNAQRYFYTIAALVILITTVIGFLPFYRRGEGMAGREISPVLFPLVAIHGVLMTSWVVVFLVQAILIPARKRQAHMKLGWGGLAVALGVTITGIIVAVKSVLPVPDVPFWGMAYKQFLFVMLAEISLFTVFVIAGILWRKRPERHRAMMLLASLSILAGATVRMPMLFPVFGESGPLGIFGPIFTLGTAFLVVRSFLKRSFDKWFAAGLATMIVVYVAACNLAVSGAWTEVARAIFKV